MCGSGNQGVNPIPSTAPVKTVLSLNASSDVRFKHADPATHVIFSVVVSPGQSVSGYPERSIRLRLPYTCYFSFLTQWVGVGTDM